MTDKQPSHPGKTNELTDYADKQVLFTADEVEALRAVDRSRISELEESIENASIAAAETSPSWKHRCHDIMGALGIDYGDPDWLMPRDRRRLEAALARVEELETLLGEKSMSQDEVERLLDAEQALERHRVEYDGSLSPDIWHVRSIWSTEGGGTMLSAHPTRWAAIAAAALADREYVT
ncbi:hypothetical protein G6L37_02370 [Agrobacterium rubi]|nr:hypothetical protein [Agrobacterium rubi]NTF24240.1 hypothetical protein [Agrobacterium rubi]